MTHYLNCQVFPLIYKHFIRIVPRRVSLTKHLLNPAILTDPEQNNITLYAFFVPYHKRSLDGINSSSIQTLLRKYKHLEVMTEIQATCNFSYIKNSYHLSKGVDFLYKIPTLLRENATIQHPLTGLLIGHGEKSQISGTNSWKNRSILQDFCSNFWGKLHSETIIKICLILWEFSGQILLRIDRFCDNLTSVFNVFLKRDNHSLF